LNSRRVPLKPPVKHPHIALKRVESSAIKAIGHDPKRNVLRIEFLTGGVYDYSGVTAEEHDALHGADSHGQHFQKFIRNRSFTKLPKAA
jgi:hypothetical protein